MPEPFRDEIKRIWETAAQPFNALWDWAKQPDDPERRAERWEALAEWAGSHKRQADHDSEAHKDWKRKQRIYRKRARANQEPDDADVPVLEDGGWHPDARRVQVQAGIGAMNGPPKLLWHSTEGFGLPTYSGSHPHFTIDPEAGVLYQHISIRSGAMALQNLAGGVETNRDGVIQVEIIGFAGRMHLLSEQALDNLAELARWIETHAGVPRKCGVTFVGNASGSSRLAGSTWDGYSGHLGHQHAPENDHWDPGALDVAAILA